MTCIMSCTKLTFFCASMAVSTLAEEKTRLKDKAAEHKNAIQTRNHAYPLAGHYQQAGHSSISFLKVMVIEVVPRPSSSEDFSLFSVLAEYVLYRP